KYAPIRSLLFRGSWSQGFRIPTISDFFAGQGQSFDPLVDPCVANPTLPNCPAHATQTVTQLPVTVGGNANLTPERAISRTIGFVYSPTYIPGFDVSADYYKVEVVNAISPGGIGPQNILDFCYSAVNLDCSLIQRSNANYKTNGEITDILSLNQNVGGIKTEGWDVNLDYRFPSTPIGDFKINADLTFTQNFVTSFLGVNPQGVPTEFTKEVAGSVTSLI
ncbi:TonB-dependent receptor, partial [mine drainage metagenome]